MKVQVFKNFLSETELYEIESGFRRYTDVDLWLAPYHEGRCQALYIYPGPKYKDSVCSYMNQKINAVLNQEHHCDSWHILNSYLPYGIHTDAYDDSDPNAFLHSDREGFKFGYTFLVPLSDYDTNTVVFNEKAEYTKNWHTWREKENITPQHTIDQETYNRYLTHESEAQISYFSIEAIFPWNKGDLLVMPRSSFHCSDNFLKNNLFEKRALIGWSYTPINN